MGSVYLHTSLGRNISGGDLKSAVQRLLSLSLADRVPSSVQKQWDSGKCRELLGTQREALVGLQRSIT